MKRFLSKKIVGIIIITFISFCIIPNNTNSIDTYRKWFVLAYYENNFPYFAHKIRVKYSENGFTWSDGEFPSDSHLEITSHGVGLMASDIGALQFTMQDSTDQLGCIKFVTGLTPAIWDQTSIDSHTPFPKSAPSGIHLQDNLYAVAHRTSSDTLFVGIWDTTSREFTGTNYAPSSSYNIDISLRPSLNKMGNTILLAWIKGSDLITAKGTFDGSQIVFSAPIEVPLSATEVYSEGCSYTAPAICNDGEMFYISFVRRRPGVRLTGWDVVLLESVDGETWENQRRIFGCAPDVFLNMACGTDGRLLVIKINDSGAGTDIDVIMLYPQNGWSSLTFDSSDIFGSVDVLAKQFSLISTKIPEISPLSFGWFFTLSSIVLIGIVIRIRIYIRKRK